MKVELLPGRELSDDLIARWIRIQEGDPALASPFLRPEFFAAVAAARKDVFVGVIEDAGAPIGFFPFQKEWPRSAFPVGAPLNERQAIIGGRPDLDPLELVSACGLVSWDFDELLASETALTPFHIKASEAPVIELPQGWRAYRESVSQRGSDLFRQSERKERKLGREVGPIRFEPRVTDRTVLERLLKWKSAQCRRTGIFDVFKFDWPLRMVERILEVQDPSFAGTLSALYAGDELVAAHMGMHSNGVWHWWFPSYDLRRASYSPGVILLLKMIAATDELGIRRIDFGDGPEPYKVRAQTGTIPVANGRVECPSAITTLRKGRRRVMAALRQSSLSSPVDALAGLVRRAEKRLRSR